MSIKNGTLFISKAFGMEGLIFSVNEACMWGVQKIFGLISNFYERKS